MRVLLATALVTLVAAYLVVRAGYGDLPPLPRYAPASLVALALAEVVGGSGVRARLAGSRGLRPLPALTVARAAALAKASSLVGALVTGGYGALALYTLSRRSDVAAARRDSVISVLGVLAAIALTAAALYLERSCRTPKPPDAATSGPPASGVPGQRPPGPAG